MLLLSPVRLLILLGLSFFLGLAFEEQYGTSSMKPPGGIRTFPLLSFAGAGLYALGAWLLAYYRAWLGRNSSEAEFGAELVVPTCNMLAYALGAVALAGPLWVGISFTVVAVILLGARRALHNLARQVPYEELVTLGKFLVLSGIILPLLPDKPITTLTSITPYQAWLAVVVVSGLSYCSYLAQRLLLPRHSGLITALLGGLYSSTATTAVLARRSRQGSSRAGELQAGIVLATAVMYLRVWIIVAIFNASLARELFPALFALAAIALVLSGLIYLSPRRNAIEHVEVGQPANPLELNTALIFAVLFVVVSLASDWVHTEFGISGVFGLAALVGITDVNPFVLSIAQGAIAGSSLHLLAIAILVATSSNNVLRAVYAIGLGGYRNGAVPAGALVMLGGAGLALPAFLR